MNKTKNTILFFCRRKATRTTKTK